MVTLRICVTVFFLSDYMIWIVSLQYLGFKLKQNETSWRMWTFETNIIVAKKKNNYENMPASFFGVLIKESRFPIHYSQMYKQTKPTNTIHVFFFFFNSASWKWAGLKINLHRHQDVWPLPCWNIQNGPWTKEWLDCACNCNFMHVWLSRSATDLSRWFY